MFQKARMIYIHLPFSEDFNFKHHIMKKTLLYLSLICSLTAFSQVKPKTKTGKAKTQNQSQTPLTPHDSLKKYHYIYLDIDKYTVSTTSTNMSTGQSRTSSSQRMDFIYRIGSEGKEGKFKFKKNKDQELVKLLKSDPEASAEYEKAMDELHKMKRCRMYSLLGIVGIIGGGALALAGVIKNDDSSSDGDGMPLIIAGGVIGVGGLVDMYLFNFKSGKHFNNIPGHMEKAVEIYNDHLMAKVK